MAILGLLLLFSIKNVTFVYPTNKTTNPIMSKARSLLLDILLMLALPLAVCGQDLPDYDYRHYKFYDSDDTSEWWLPVADSLVSYDSWGYDAPAADARYALAALSSVGRGLDYGHSGYVVGHLEVDYITARQLGSLGIARNRASGCGAYILGSEGEATAFDMHAMRRYRGHYLRGELSGRNYLWGVSHRGVYKPERSGVSLRDGMTVAHYARVRSGRDLYVDGVYTNALDLGFDVAYVDRQNSLRVVVLVPWSERGLSQASTAEVYGLLGNVGYNPSWGMQDGKMRNSRVATMLRPEVVASWQRRITVNTTLDISLNYGFERGGRSMLSWFDAPTAAPDNYRSLPSFFDDDNQRRAVTDAWVANDMRYTQIDWEGLYHTNALQSDGHARYVVDLRRENRHFVSAAAGFNFRIGSVDMECGIDLGAVSSRRFKVVDDLLGADHILNIDYYLVDDVTYSNRLDNDLNNPQRVIHEGDRYGYDYRLVSISAGLYANASWHRGPMELLLDMRLASDMVWRRGFFEKELFPGSGSYGASLVRNFAPCRLSAMWGYNFGEHRMAAAFMLEGRRPDVEDLFLQPDYNNRYVEHAGLERSVSADISYRYEAQRVRVEASMFLLYEADGSDVVRYYDDLAATYADVVMSGIATLRCGAEVGAEVTWSRMLSSNFRGEVGRYRYASNPVVTLYADSDNSIAAHSVALVKGCSVGAPEVRLYGDICFQPASSWLARLSLQYWGARYVTPSLVRRSERVLSRASSAEEVDMLCAQQRLRDAATLDLSLSKSFRFESGCYLRLQLDVRNILGATIIRDGYEQNRVRQMTTYGQSHLQPFDNRLRYAYPRTFYLSVGLGF